jgi:hypothetical protein
VTFAIGCPSAVEARGWGRFLADATGGQNVGVEIIDPQLAVAWLRVVGRAGPSM